MNIGNKIIIPEYNILRNKILFRYTTLFKIIERKYIFKLKYLKKYLLYKLKKYIFL